MELEKLCPERLNVVGVRADLCGYDGHGRVVVGMVGVGNGKWKDRGVAAEAMAGNANLGPAH